MTTLKILGLLTVGALCLCQSAALAQNPVLVGACTNTPPRVDQLFGNALAALGSDRIVIGASCRGSFDTNDAAYLFGTNCVRLATFTNPTPADNIFYGRAVTAVGSDRVCVGAYQSGFNSGQEQVWLFDTNGIALIALSNNAPIYSGASFGRAVLGFGSDRVVIGGPVDYPWSVTETHYTCGLVHLFATNGTLLTTITNPAPASGDNFGLTLARPGDDLVLIGAPYDDAGATDAGTVYLYNTNGVLLRTFNNVTPATGDLFGWSMAALGNDMILVGAPGDDTVATNSGAVYLLHTNGTLLRTFTSPAAAVGDQFGASLAAVGANRFLVGAPGTDRGATDGGVAYLFSTNGTLLLTFTNPAPAASDLFSVSVAMLGSECPVIGAPWDNPGGADSGSVYLFSLPPAPTLAIRRTTTNTLVVSWPLAAANFVLQKNSNSITSLNWSNVTTGIQTNGTNKVLLMSPTDTLGLFMRLVLP